MSTDKAAKDAKFWKWVINPEFPHIEDPRAINHAKIFIDRLTSESFPKPLFKHQQEAVLRTVYEGEMNKDWSVLLDIVTGGGKTVIMASLIAYFWQVHRIEKFLIVVPNTIVRERVKEDFDITSPGYAYEDFPLFFNSYTNVKDRLVCKVLRGRGDEASIRDANVIVANIHQLYDGKTALEVLAADHSTPEFVIFNDEAHNAAAREYREVLKSLQRKTYARVDLTATPFRLDKQDLDTYPPIYSYQVQEATKDRVVKQTLVTKPDIKRVKMQYEEWDDENNVVRTLDAEDVPWDQVERELKRSGAVKFVTAKHARKQQLQIAQSCLDYQVKSVKLGADGKPSYTPLMLVVALSTKDAGQIYETLLTKPFGYKPEEVLLVHSKQTGENEAENRKAFLLGRKSAEGLTAEEAALWHQTRKVKIIIGVGMLREGWDVRNISVICLFRKFSYAMKGNQKYTVYGPQIIGRGLRKINFGKQYIDHLFVADHPAFDHDWLWQLMGSEQYSKPLNPGDEIDDEIIETIDEEIIEEAAKSESESSQGDAKFDVDELMNSISEKGYIEPIKDWQAYLKGIDWGQRLSSAIQEITGVKTNMIGTGNTAHELPDDAINTPEDINAVRGDVNKSTGEKRQEILGELKDLPRNALHMAFRQVTTDELNKMKEAVSWCLKELFGVESIADINKADEGKINKLYHALPRLTEEMLKPEMVLGIIQDGAE